MTTFLQQIVNGVVSGSTFALLALGFTLVFGILRVLNLAHPHIYMWGAFFAFVGAEAHLPVVVIALLAVFGSAAWGVAIDRCVFRWMRESAMATPFIATMGLGLFMESLAVKVWGPQPAAIPTMLPTTVVHLGGLHVSVAQLVTIGSVIVLMVLLWLVIERTWFGRTIRATSENVEAAGALGISTERVMVATIALASAFAGIAGFLIATLYNQAFAYMGDTIGLEAMVVMMIGGLGNVTGAVVGGLLLGIVQSLTTGYVSASYADGVAFAFLFLVLVVRPEGLFGERLRTK